MNQPVRPEFEPLTVEVGGARRPWALLPWLRLMRLPNVFTAIADVLMGVLFVRGAFEPAGVALALVTATVALYTAGMVLNDVFDFAIDAGERPSRPLPSGQIRRWEAAALGGGLLVMGVASGWVAGALAAGGVFEWRRGMVASVLAACIVAYDAWLKHTPAGPLAMGACRFFNVLLGMSAAPGTGVLVAAYGTAEILAAAGVGVYIVGVTLLARGEAGVSRRGALAAAMVVMAAGVTLLGASGAYRSALAMERTWFWLLLGLLTAIVLRRCAAALADPRPQNVQAAVKHSILSLIWLDAAVAAAVAGPGYGLAIAALLIPALFLGRWVYST